MALRVAIFGATGMVGRELIRVLDKRAFPFASLQGIRLRAFSRKAA